MKILNYFEEVVLCVAFIVITVLTFLNVVSRNLMGLSISFTEEITINVLVLITFLGASMGVRRYAHLGFTLIFDKAGKGLKQGIVIFSGLVSFILFGVLTWYGIDMLLFQMDMNQKTPALGLPQWILSLALPIGTLCCIIRTIQVVVEELKDGVVSGDVKGERQS